MAIYGVAILPTAIIFVLVTRNKTKLHNVALFITYSKMKVIVQQQQNIKNNLPVWQSMSFVPFNIQQIAPYLFC